MDISKPPVEIVGSVLGIRGTKMSTTNAIFTYRRFCSREYELSRGAAWERGPENVLGRV